jgi:hypothetical protein
VALGLGTAAPLAAQTQALIVSGLGGEPRYQERFLRAALDLARAARERLAAAPEDVVVLAEDPSRDAGIAARSTTGEISSRLRALSGRAAPQGLLLVVLLGHGSVTGGEPRLNLPGPDLTPAALAEMLRSFSTQSIVVVNAASASGDWIEPLSGPRRAIVTATRSGLERDETHFAAHFAAALGADDADRDKDGRLSVFEAFEYARREVARLYQRDQRLQTEHALLDADGDKVGDRAPQSDAGDGAAASAFFLTSRPAARGGEAPSGLAAARDSLEREVALLRSRRDTMSAEEYDRRLEAVLLELARVNRELKGRQEEPQREEREEGDRRGAWDP